MTVLKGRPEKPGVRQAISNTPTGNVLADDEVMKVTTRLTVRQIRAMKVSAAQQGLTIEQAYSEAVDAYLGGR